MTDKGKEREASGARSARLTCKTKVRKRIVWLWSPYTSGPGGSRRGGGSQVVSFVSSVSLIN